MKAISLLTLGAALLATNLAFAQASQDSQPSTGAKSSSNNADIQQSNAPANNMPSKAADANDTSTTSAAMASTCQKQASDKKLTGDAKTKFMGDCKKGKTTRSGN